MGGRTVAIQFVRAALDMMQTRGHNAPLLLETAGIPSELAAEDDARVTEAQAARLIRALWDVSDDELLGVGPKPMPRGTFRMMTLGLIHASDLSAVLTRSVEFSRIAFGVDVSIVDDDGMTRLALTARDSSALAPPVAALVLAVIHRFGGWLIGRTIELEAVTLTGAEPTAPAEYLAVYGVAPEFDSATAGMVFDSRCLRAPVVQDEQSLDDLIRRSPNELLFRQQYRRSTTDRVRRIIEGSGAPGRVTVDAAANQLSISNQHLRRLLREDGSSFRSIRDDVLRDQAISSLVGGSESVDALSARLGFSEPSAFRRAFRRWTGNAPSFYRPPP